MRCTGHWLFVLVVTASFLSGPAAADSSPGRALPLSPAGDLQVHVPEGWQAQARPDKGDGLRTVELRAADGSDFVLRVMSARMGTRVNARRVVEAASKDAGPTSVEGTPTIQSLCAGTDSGYYFTVTDKAPKPGEYARMTQGVLTRGEWAVTFTLFMNGDEAQPKARTLLMMRELCDTPAAQPPAAPGEQ